MATVTNHMEVIESKDGMVFVAGLGWKPRRSQWLRSNFQPHLEMATPNRVARLDDLQLEGSASLLVAMATDLRSTDQSTVGLWLFAAPLDGSSDGHWWTAGAAINADGAIEPALFGEHIFSGSDDCVDWLRQLNETQSIEGVVVWEDGVSGGKRLLSRKVKSLSIEDLSKKIVAGGAATDCERFKVAPHISAKMLLGGSVVAAALGSVFFYASASREPEPVFVPRFDHVVIEPGSFGQKCENHLASWWPRVTGWNVVEQGCGLVGSLPENIAPSNLGRRQPGSFVSWVRFQGDKNVNAALARASGTLLQKNWPHGSAESGDEIFLWRKGLLSLQEISKPNGPATTPVAVKDSPSIEDLFANSGDSVTFNLDGTVVVGTSSAIDGVIGRLVRLKEYEPEWLIVKWPPSVQVSLRRSKTIAIPANTELSATKQNGASAFDIRERGEG